MSEMQAPTPTTSPFQTRRLPTGDHQTGPVAVLMIDNPPLNILSVGNGTVLRLLQGLQRLVDDNSVEGIVLAGSGKCFCAGADIADFDGDPDALDVIRQLVEAVEASPKPVVAALHGHVLGGGLELALACHRRVAAPDSKFALPELSLGLLPGGGGTQRIVRLIEMEQAIALAIEGRRLGASEAWAIGLVDRCAERDVVEAAVAEASRMTAEDIRRCGRMPVRSKNPVPAIDAARTKLADRGALSPAASALLDCLAIATEGDLQEGLRFEARRFAELLVSEESLGLRHAFHAERAVAHVLGLSASGAPLDIKTVGVIGAGTMGVGIAIAALMAGLSVTLVDLRSPALEKALAQIADTLKRGVEKGRWSAVSSDRMIAALRCSDRMQDLAVADLIIEAVFEDLAVKRDVFATLDTIAKPSAILASNTSTLDLNRIADATARPGQVVGLHFFSPANVMKLLEIVRGEQTTDAVLLSAMKFARQIGKVGVVAGVCDGFIGNRLFEEYLRQAYLLLEDGALPHQIDQALEAWGMAMGPLRVMDLAGQDIGWSIRKRRAKEQPDRPYSRIPDIICEMGRFGQKSGAGYYLYPDGRTPRRDPDIDSLIIRHSADIGIQRRDISDEEIVSRCVLALVNEGAKTIEEGIALRPLDIDAVYLNGYGFPAKRGGPMFYADRLGLPRVLDRMRALEAGRLGFFWKPADLLTDLVAHGRNLGYLNAR